MECFPVEEICLSYAEKVGQDLGGDDLSDVSAYPTGTGDRNSSLRSVGTLWYCISSSRQGTC